MPGVSELPKIRAQARRAWIPLTQEGDPGVAASKFCGRPWLAEDEEWPSCPNCSQPIQLFLQLDLADLPPEAQSQYGSKGLIQLFYCVSDDPLCEVDCEAYFPFAKSVVARRIDPPTGPGNQAAKGPRDPFPARAITGWRAVDDLPNWEELEYGLEVDISSEESDALHEAGFPVEGDKLGGWPAWVQGVEYPSCTECGDTMELVFQIDSEDNVPHMFGDVGTGHLTRCARHPEIMTFAWACY